MSWQRRIDTALETRRAADTMRTRMVVKNITGRFLYHNGRKYFNFSTNDYLGLSRHQAVINAWQQGAECYGVGSGGSGHINGYTPAHRCLEEELADWLGYQRAILFISGFTANQALIIALTSSNDLIIADRYSHASLIEAAHFSPAKLLRFAHNDINQLKTLLDKPCTGQKLVVTEGIFSMDGDTAQLGDIIAAARKRNAWTLVDDAHGIGVMGKQGRGSSALYDVKPELLVITFGKGFGVSGAAVLCSETIAEYLLQFARHLIYSTSMPPAQALAILAAMRVIKGEDGSALRQQLIEHIYHFRSASVKLLNYQFTDSRSAIQPLITGDNYHAIMLAKTLRNYGIWTTAILPPTVPQGKARLRLTITAAHDQHDIDTLLGVLHDFSK